MKTSPQAGDVGMVVLANAALENVIHPFSFGAVLLYTRWSSCSLPARRSTRVRRLHDDRLRAGGEDDAQPPA
jgi:hypothetical protein